MTLPFRMNALWKTYFVIALMSIVFTLAATFVDWQRIEDRARSELNYSNGLVSHSIHNLFDKHELLLELLGNRLLEIGVTDQIKSSNLLDTFLTANPELGGLGLALPSGQLIVTSSNLAKAKDNLLDKEETLKSFKQSLSTNKMVVGRTYYVPALKQWLIPLRKRIVDKNGRTVAVMTSGITFNFLKGTLSDQSNRSNADVSLVREDFYRQYVSVAPQSDYQRVFQTPLAENLIQQISKTMKEQVGFGLDFLKSQHKGERVTFYVKNYQGKLALGSLKYDEKYHFYSSVWVEKALIVNKLYERLFWYVILLLLFNVSLYFLFRVNMDSQNESHQELEFQAMHDQLTKLPNRRYLLEAFDAWKHANKNGFAVFFIDLDSFKNINDLYGHSVGDRVLLEVSTRVVANFDNCLCVRQGGDEFIILTHSNERVHNLNACRNFLTHLYKPFVLDGFEFSLKASLGVVQYPNDGRQLDELLSKADMAMYEAKRLRCGFFPYSEGLQEKTQRIAVIERELIHALEREEFFIVYQPQFNATSKKMIGVEALLRWDNPSLGFVPPDEFIAVAESIGLIHDIGLFVFETALTEFINVCHITNKNREKLRLSVNVSVQQLFHPSFLESISQLQKRHDCSAIELMVEVTESLFIDDVGLAKKILLALRGKDIQVSLDDFGTGYSSLGVLSGLPINELKIDKTFVDNILNNSQDLQLIKSIISLGNGLGIPVIAEGVEQAEQVSTLSKNGCDFFQGYYFSKPLNKADLITFILK